MTNKQKCDLIHKFYFDQITNCQSLENYGKYRLGLTSEEVRDYLHVRALQRKGDSKLLTAKQLEKLCQIYADIAGCKTGVVVDGYYLYYRHDVERYSEKLFNKTETFFD